MPDAAGPPRLIYNPSLADVKARKLFRQRAIRP